MIDGLRPYPETKPTGLSWLGEVPTHWGVVRAKRLLKATETPVRPDDEIVTCFRDGQVTLRKNRRSSGFMIALLEQGYQGVRAGQLVVHSMDAFAGAIGVSDSDGKCTPEYIVCDPRNKKSVVPGYYSWVLRQAARTGYILASCPAVRERAPRLRYPDLGELRVPVPPLDEQRLIVRFLDWHGGQTAKLVRAKKKLVALLNEQKQAIIHRAVTRGLDPNVRLRPSGVPWLGDVPGGWETVPFKHRVGFQEGPGIMAVDFRECGVPLLRISGLHTDEANLEGCNFLDPSMVDKRWRHFRIKDGDYLLSSSASTGKICLATEIVEGAIPYTGIIRLWPIASDVAMPFLKHLIGARPFQDQLDAAKSGVAIAHFGPTHLKRISICLPPRSEQDAIAQHIAETTVQFSNASASISREITLLQEFRTRLIADVVIGKLDVRAAAASLPEIIELEPTDDDDLDETVEDMEHEEIAA